MVSKKDFFKYFLATSAGFTAAKMHSIVKDLKYSQQKELQDISIETRKMLNLTSGQEKFISQALSSSEVQDEVYQLFIEEERECPGFNEYQKQLKPYLEKIDIIDEDIHNFFFIFGLQIVSHLGAKRRSENYLKYLEAHTARQVVDTYWKCKAEYPLQIEFWEALLDIMDANLTIAERVYKILFKAIHYDEIAEGNELLYQMAELDGREKGSSTKVLDFINSLYEIEKKVFRKKLTESFIQDQDSTRDLIFEAIKLGSNKKTRRFFIKKGMI
ncbi:hypothetical protein K8R32_04865 [bacterium]|nr:hypothetical protein [bacterium]